MANFLKDRNRFNLAPPPPWWLAKLTEFDDSLVVVPSRMVPLFRLGQRRPPDLKVNLVHSIHADSDSKMLASYGLVPVTTIVGNAKWDNPVMWEDLRQRSPSRMGGAEKFEQALYTKELRAKLKKAKATDDMITQLSRDGWGMYQKRIGLRNQMYSPNVKHQVVTPRSNAPAIHIPK